MLLFCNVIIVFVFFYSFIVLLSIISFSYFLICPFFFLSWSVVLSCSKNAGGLLVTSTPSSLMCIVRMPFWNSTCLWAMFQPVTTKRHVFSKISQHHSHALFQQRVRGKELQCGMQPRRFSLCDEAPAFMTCGITGKWFHHLQFMLSFLSPPFITPLHLGCC